MAVDVDVSAPVDTDIPEPPSGGGGSAHIIQDESISLTPRSKLNFLGAGVTVTDNAGADSSDVTIPSGGSSLPVVDTTAIVKGSVDDTKLLRFEVDGFTAGATRVMTPPNADATLAGLGVDQTWTGVQTFGTAGGAVSKLRIAGSVSDYVVLDAPASGAGAVMTLPPTATVIAGLAVTQTWTGVQTFGSAGAVNKLLIAGNTSGSISLVAPAVASTYNMTFPAGSVTLAGINFAQTWTQAQTFDTTIKLHFRDSAIYIQSSVDGQMDIVADDLVKIGGAVGDVSVGEAADVTARIFGPLSANNWDLGTSALPFAAAYLGGNIEKYNNVTTAGYGVPAIYATGRVTAKTNVTSGTIATYTLPAADGSFLISANVLVTTSTTHNFTVTCTYTDEGNTARTFTFGFVQLSGGTLLTAITNITGAGPYESPVYQIRCKASSTITILTAAAGTYTGVVYNAEGLIQQTA